MCSTAAEQAPGPWVSAHPAPMTHNQKHKHGCAEQGQLWADGQPDLQSHVNLHQHKHLMPWKENLFSLHLHTHYRKVLPEDNTASSNFTPSWKLDAPRVFSRGKAEVLLSQLTTCSWWAARDSYSLKQKTQAIISATGFRQREWMNEWMKSSPINDASFMEKHKGWNNFCSIEPGPIFIEATRLLNMEHQVPAIYELHHKEQAILHTRKHNRHEQH